MTRQKYNVQAIPRMLTWIGSMKSLNLDYFLDSGYCLDRWVSADGTSTAIAIPTEPYGLYLRYNADTN